MSTRFGEFLISFGPTHLFRALPDVNITRLDLDRFAWTPIYLTKEKENVDINFRFDTYQMVRELISGLHKLRKGQSSKISFEGDMVVFQIGWKGNQLIVELFGEWPYHLLETWVTTRLEFFLFLACVLGELAASAQLSGVDLYKFIRLSPPLQENID